MVASGDDHAFAGEICYVIASTPYASNHVKSLTLAEMQKQDLISSPNQNHKNTYPDGTITIFPPA